MIATIVILGASGDLTSRFLIPAIMRLHQAGELSADFRILGVARNDWNAAYVEEPGVDPGRNTETFAQVVGNPS